MNYNIPNYPTTYYNQNDERFIGTGFIGPLLLESLMDSLSLMVGPVSKWSKDIHIRLNIHIQTPKPYSSSF